VAKLPPGVGEVNGEMMTAARPEADRFRVAGATCDPTHPHLIRPRNDIDFTSITP